MYEKIDEIIKEILPEIIAIRRKIHQNPELGFEEHETAKLVAQFLKDLGLEVKENVAKTGVVGLLRCNNPNAEKTLLIRADMDALPLDEENTLEFKSKNKGKAHMCGHDSHVAIILGVAKVLAQFKDKLKGNVKFVFQPAEEGPGGALPMVQAGVLENPKVTAAMALHVDSATPTGKIGLKKGYVTASADEYHITLKGPGGHASAPHKTKDLVAIGVQLVQTLYNLPHREIDPLEPVVLTIGKFHAGTRHNIIGDRAEIAGTLRTLNEEVRKTLVQRIKDTVNNIAAFYSIDAEIVFNPGSLGYSSGWNDPTLVDIAANAISEALGKDSIEWLEKPLMGAEDFFEFGNQRKIPTLMMLVGTRNEEKGYIYPMHSSHFILDEESIPIGMKAMSSCALKYLNE